ncbi:MAG TPA: acetate--CoA ligase family protein [Polyangiales bacterium]
MTWPIVCESAELAVQCLHLAQQLDLAVQPSVETDWLRATREQRASGQATAVLLLRVPKLSELVELAECAHGTSAALVLGVVGAEPGRKLVLDAAGDLGLIAVSEIRPLLAALALLAHCATEAFCASPRSLSAADRARLKPSLAPSSKTAGQLVSVDATRIGWCAQATQPAVTLGEPRDVAEALDAMRRTERSAQLVSSSVDDVDPHAVLDVIFGPRRALSDPASKAALSPYGLPLPVEELCSSPSRAAAEASRIGFPVRISLASPDLRIWDHPDLSVDMVDNAARVRDTFHQLLAVAHDRLASDPSLRAAADNRLLGVMVTATSEAHALLGVRATPLPRGRVAIEVGFADPHGRAASDQTVAILPATLDTLERSLRRLQGADLLFAAPLAQRRTRVDAICDVLLRLAAFVHERREEIECVELRPLALLLDGSVEVREACVSVSDHFERSMAQAPSAAATR